MKTYNALFRGINVGGSNTLSMKDLVLLLEDIGCRNVKTSIHSGDAVFRSIIIDALQLSVDHHNIVNDLWNKASEHRRQHINNRNHHNIVETCA